MRGWEPGTQDMTKLLVDKGRGVRSYIKGTTLINQVPTWYVELKVSQQP